MTDAATEKLWVLPLIGTKPPMPCGAWPHTGTCATFSPHTGTRRGNGAVTVTAVAEETATDAAVTEDRARDSVRMQDLLTAVARFWANGARQRPCSSLASKALGAEGGVSTAERPAPIEPQAMLLRLLCRDSGRKCSARTAANPGRMPCSHGDGDGLRIGMGWQATTLSVASYPWKRGGGWLRRSTCTNASLSLSLRHDVRDLSRASLASMASLKTALGGDLKSTNLGASRPSGLTPVNSPASKALSCSTATNSASSNAAVSERLAALRWRSAEVGVPPLQIRAERGLRAAAVLGLFFGVQDGLFRGLLGALMVPTMLLRRAGFCLMTDGARSRTFTRKRREAPCFGSQGGVDYSRPGGAEESFVMRGALLR